MKPLVAIFVLPDRNLPKIRENLFPIVKSEIQIRGNFSRNAQNRQSAKLNCSENSVPHVMLKFEKSSFLIGFCNLPQNTFYRVEEKFAIFCVLYNFLYRAVVRFNLCMEKSIPKKDILVVKFVGFEMVPTKVVTCFRF